jgi:hypothetical protein
VPFFRREQQRENIGLAHTAECLQRLLGGRVQHLFAPCQHADDDERHRGGNWNSRCAQFSVIHT